MPGLIEELREKHDTRQGAAREMGRGLMRGSRPDFKLGYSYENAELKASESFELGPVDVLELRCYLLGFAVGMHRTRPDSTAEQEMLGRLDAESERYAAAYREGHERGLEEDALAIYPDRIASLQEDPEMESCGCGAMEPGECAAAVEGHFTSLGQRSEEELRSLAEGDDCKAAAFMLARREEQS
jgi:hypothetical protein